MIGQFTLDQVLKKQKKYLKARVSDPLPPRQKWNEEAKKKMINDAATTADEILAVEALSTAPSTSAVASASSSSTSTLVEGGIIDLRGFCMKKMNIRGFL